MRWVLAAAVAKLASCCSIAPVDVAHRRPCRGSTPAARHATRACATPQTHRRWRRSWPSCGPLATAPTLAACLETHSAAEFHSSGWIRSIDLTIMSRVRAANGGAARSRQSKDPLEIEWFARAGMWRRLSGVCAIVDAWWTSVGPPLRVSRSTKLPPALGSFPSIARSGRSFSRHSGDVPFRCEAVLRWRAGKALAPRPTRASRGPVRRCATRRMWERRSLSVMRRRRANAPHL